MKEENREFFENICAAIFFGLCFVAMIWGMINIINNIFGFK